MISFDELFACKNTIVYLAVGAYLSLIKEQFNLSDRLFITAKSYLSYDRFCKLKPVGPR